MNLQKVNRSAVAAHIKHDERTAISFSNENIDLTLSHNNVNYKIGEGSAQEIYDKRMSEVFCINRKDINTLAEISIHLPIEVKEKDKDKFFKAVYNCLAAKFGEKNIISAIVHEDEPIKKGPHKDEIHSHMHFKFIPVYTQTKTLTKGKDKGKTITRECVSYDEVCSREVYRAYHKEVQEYVDKELEYHVGIINGGTLGVKTIEDVKKVHEYRNEAEELEKQIAVLNQQVIDQKQQLEEITNEAQKICDIALTTRRELFELNKNREKINDELQNTLLDLVANDACLGEKSGVNIVKRYFIDAYQDRKAHAYENDPGRFYFRLPTKIADWIHETLHKAIELFGQRTDIDRQIDEVGLNAIKQIDERAASIIISIDDVEKGKIVNGNQEESQQIEVSKKLNFLPGKDR